MEKPFHEDIYNIDAVFVLFFSLYKIKILNNYINETVILNTFCDFTQHYPYLLLLFTLQARLLWEHDQEKSTHLPHFVDKALRLLNLKQVAFEIENSVMSKVSCTACKAGNIVIMFISIMS